MKFRNSLRRLLNIFFAIIIIVLCIGIAALAFPEIVLAQSPPASSEIIRIFEGTPESAEKTFTEQTLPDPLDQGVELTIELLVNVGRLELGEQVIILTEMDGIAEGTNPVFTIVPQKPTVSKPRTLEAKQVSLSADEFQEGIIQIFGRVKAEKKYISQFIDTSLPLEQEVSPLVRSFKLYELQLVKGDNTWTYGKLERSSVHPDADSTLATIPEDKADAVKDKLNQIHERIVKAQTEGDILTAQLLIEQYNDLVALGEENTWLGYFVFATIAAVGGWFMFLWKAGFLDKWFK